MRSAAGANSPAGGARRDSHAPTTRAWAAPGALAAVIVLFVAAHLPTARAPYTNIECWTAAAAERAAGGQVLDSVEVYQRAVSSPPFSFFAIVPVFQVFGAGE